MYLVVCWTPYRRVLISQWEINLQPSNELHAFVRTSVDRLPSTAEEKLIADLLVHRLVRLIYISNGRIAPFDYGRCTIVTPANSGTGGL